MTPKQREAIEAHGEDLLRIFPDASKRDPQEICRRLRALESEAHRLAERLCNDWDPTEEERELAESKILAQVQRLLGDKNGRVWLNGDPRGYALKVDLREGERLHTDWGGYGIIAPEIDAEGN